MSLIGIALRMPLGPTEAERARAQLEVLVHYHCATLPLWRWMLLCERQIQDKLRDVAPDLAGEYDEYAVPERIVPLTRLVRDQTRFLVFVATSGVLR